MTGYIFCYEIDQLSYDYDLYQYKDTLEDKEAQMVNITEDEEVILNTLMISLTQSSQKKSLQIFSDRGTELIDGEAVQTARKAKELLDRLAEYKPLAKIKELEEQNYNMIDNLLNNGQKRKKYSS